jgi:hypothetical protein
MPGSEQKMDPSVRGWTGGDSGRLHFYGDTFATTDEFPALTVMLARDCIVEGEISKMEFRNVAWKP